MYSNISLKLESDVVGDQLKRMGNIVGKSYMYTAE